MSPREWLCATFLCLIAYPLSLLMLCGPRLFDMPFWADETLSWLISSDADFSHGMAALAGGVDTNAPVLHLFYRVIGNAFGHTPRTYRIASCVVMSLGLLGVYATLRRFVCRLPAFVATLSMIALPIILIHTTEARFYALFLSSSIWTCYFIDRRADRPSIGNAAGLAILSILLCGSHYFGILIIGCIGLFVVGRGLRSRLADAMETLWPMIAGLAMTATLLPLLRTQREALAGADGTWVPDHFMQNLATTIYVLLPMGTLVVTLALVFIARSFRKSRNARTFAFAPTSLLSLLIFPVVMIVVDRVIQPVLVPRYLIPSLAGLAVVIASCVVLIPAWTRLATIAALMFFFTSTALRYRNRIANPQPQTGMGILAQVPHDGLPIVVDWRGHLLAIWADRPDQRDRIYFVDDHRITHPDLDQSIPFEREMVRIMNRYYGFPKTISTEKLRDMGRFRLVTEFPESVADRFTEFSIKQQHPLSWIVGPKDVTADVK